MKLEIYGLCLPLLLPKCQYKLTLNLLLCLNFCTYRETDRHYLVQVRTGPPSPQQSGRPKCFFC